MMAGSSPGLFVASVAVALPGLHQRLVTRGRLAHCDLTGKWGRDGIGQPELPGAPLPMCAGQA